MERDYIEEAQQEAQLRFGRELSAEELATKFAGHDSEARIFHLKTMRGDDELTLNEGVRRMEYESKLRAMHELLRKVGR